MSCLEALLSTDSSELSHKLAERVAVFIGKNGAERKAKFSTLKRAYNVRSTVLHGDVLTSQKDLHVVSQEVDEVVRDILSILLNTDDLKTVFEGKKEDIDSYFTDLLFTK
jgi:hypothetical protein